MLQRRQATRDILDVLEKSLAAGLPVAVATVVETWGSAPRAPGAAMAVAGDGVVAGSVSGGCVESAVVLESSAVIETGQPRLLRFGVADDDAFAVGLSCGGEINVLVERWSDDAAQLALRDALCRDEPVASVLGLDEALLGRRLTVTPERLTGSRQDAGGSGSLGDEAPRSDALDREAADAAGKALARRRSETVDIDGSRFFVAAYPPRDKLVIFGAVHIAQPLAQMAHVAGFHVTVADSRVALATGERFPDVDRIEVGRPAAVLGGVSLDESTYVAVLTHDPKLDDPAIVAALESPARYVGVLGSSRTHAARLARLRDRGVSDDQLERLHAPIGLDLGATTPAEIAVSILAEIVAARR